MGLRHCHDPFDRDRRSQTDKKQKSIFVLVHFVWDFGKKLVISVMYSSLLLETERCSFNITYFVISSYCLNSA